MQSKSLGAVLLIIGVILLIFGVTAWQSISSEISQAVSGTPNTKSIILIVLSILFLVFGGYSFFKDK